MVREVKPVQPEKAELPMEVTLLGMVMEVKPMQPLKEFSPMDLTPLPSVTSFNVLRPLNQSVTSAQDKDSDVIELQP